MPEEPAATDVVAQTSVIWAAVNRQDWEAVLSFFAPDARYDMAPIGMGTFEGHAALRREWEETYAYFDEHRWEPVEILDLGHGIVLVALAARGRLRSSTSGVELRMTWVYEWESGKVQSVTLHDADKGRAAAERLAAQRA